MVDIVIEGGALEAGSRDPPGDGQRSSRGERRQRYPDVVAVLWRYLREDGTETGTSEPFADREAAEAWMGEAWQDLLAGGVEQVVLMDGDRRVYRMGLREA